MLSGPVGSFKLSSSFLSCGADLRLGAEPVVDVVSVLAPTLFIECVSPTVNLLFTVGVGFDLRSLFLGRFNSSSNSAPSALLNESGLLDSS